MRRLFIVLLFMFVLPISLVAAPISFGPTGSYTTWHSAYFIGVGDFNGDGYPDVAQPHYGQDVIYVSLNNGAGGYLGVTPYTVSLTPNNISVADLNNDSKLDLIVTHAGGTTALDILLGNGDGTFQTPLTYTTVAQSYSSAVGDFNNDGKLDVAIAGMSSNIVQILIGNGDGSLQAPVSYATGGSTPSSVVTGDLDGDGDLDLAVANWDSADVNVLLGVNDGTFVNSGQSISVGTNPYYLVTADFDGDGALDLATANYGSANASVMLNNGAGTMSSGVNYSVGTDPLAIAVGDLNIDGILDLAVTNSGDDTVSTLQGNGDGTFQTAVARVAGDYPSGLAIVDTTNDGREDLLVVHHNVNQLYVYPNNVPLPNNTPTVTTPISDVTVDEDATDSIVDLTTSFDDVEDGTNLTYTVESNDNTGLVSTSISGGDLTLSYTADASGTANITVRGTDSGDLYAEDTFLVTVNAVNDAPTITTTAPTSATVGVLYSYTPTVDDVDGPGVNLTVDAVNDTCGGSIWSGADYQFTPGSLGDCVVGIQVCDGGSPEECTTEATTVTVSGAAPSDTEAPVVNDFTVNGGTVNAYNSVVSISLSVSDNVGVTGYMITEIATAPSSGDAGWLGTAPVDYDLGSAGSYTLYAWVKDAEGNVSDSALMSVSVEVFSLALSDNAGGGINATFQGDVTVTVDGAIPGNTILLEQLVDIGSDGYDGGDVVVRSLQASAAGGTAAFILNYSDLFDRFHAFGDYVFRATDISAGSGEAASTFTVGRINRPNNLTGVVKDSGATVLEGAFVRLEDKWGNIYGYGLTNASGQYTIDIPSSAVAPAGDSYLVYPLAYGYAADVPATPVVFSGTDSAPAITLPSAGSTITGQVFNGGSGVSGVEVVASNGSHYSVALTDVGGNYTLAVPAGDFNVELAGHGDLSPALQGYIDDGSVQEVAAGDSAIDFSLAVAPETIIGQVSGGAVAGIPVEATNGSGARSYAVSDFSGNYVLNVTSAAGWSVMPKKRVAQSLAYIGSKLTVDTSGGSQVGQDLTLYPFDGWVDGSIIDKISGTPVVGAEVYVSNGTWYSSVETDAAGYFSVPLVMADGLSVGVDALAEGFDAPADVPVDLVDFDGNTATVDFAPMIPTLHYDLVATIVSGVPVTANAGDVVTINATIENVGTIDLNLITYASLYVSEDPEVTTSDYRLAYHKVVSIVAGGSIDVTFVGTLPSLLPGTYYLGVIPDMTNTAPAEASGETAYGESNAAAQAFDILSGAYDLVTSNVQVTPDTNHKPGDLITVSATIENIGASDLNLITYLGAFFSIDDNEITRSDRRLKYYKLDRLYAGATVDVSFGYTVPALSPGTYYIGALADYTNRATKEANEANNASAVALVINQPPSITTNAGATFDEGSTDNVVGQSVLETSDTDNTPDELTYTLTAVPVNGTLSKSGTELVVSDTFTQADLNAGIITYDHDGSETLADSFDFDVVDDALEGFTGQTFSIIVNPINDPPALVTISGTFDEGSTGNVLDSSNIEATDPDNTAAELTFTLTTAPSNGTMYRGGTPLGAGGTFTQADVNSGLVTYTHDGSETTTDVFDVKVEDLEPLTATMLGVGFNITPVNDPPAVTTNSGASFDNGSTGNVVGQAVLETSDPDNPAAELTYTVTAVPVNGTLFKSGTPLGVNDTFTQADINGGSITYDHDGSATNSDSFDFDVADSEPLSVTGQTFSVTIP